MKLGTYVVRRLLLAIPVVLGVTLLTFAIGWTANEGHLERAYLTEKMTVEQRERIIEQYGFRDPWYVQYFRYLDRLAHGDLGLSRVVSDRPVIEVMKEFFPATFELTLVAIVVAVIFGVALGTLTAVRKDSPVDHTTRFFALAGVSVPIFWLGLVLKFALSTPFLPEIFEGGGPILGASFLFVVLGGLVALALLVADALDVPRLTWKRYGVHVAALAVAIGAFVFLDWSFFYLFFILVGGIGYAAATVLKLTDRARVPRTVWIGAGAVVAIVAIGIAGSTSGPSVVRGAWDVIPDLPLGGRFSNALLQEEGAHESLTNGPTRMLLVDTALAGDWVAFGDVAFHLVLPGITLGYASLAVIARMMRASMLEVLSLDFVRTARAKGLPDAEVVRLHARRNALIPIATVVGLTFGGLLSGAVLTETIFQWPGLGRWSVAAISSADANSVMSFTLIVTAIYLTANFIVDIAYSIIDPRVRLG